MRYTHAMMRDLEARFNAYLDALNTWTNVRHYRLANMRALETPRRYVHFPWGLKRRERPRCGAKTRAGGRCQAPAVLEFGVVRNGRCRLHGGLSTGARTRFGRWLHTAGGRAWRARHPEEARQRLAAAQEEYRQHLATAGRLKPHSLRPRRRPATRGHEESNMHTGELRTGE